MKELKFDERDSGHFRCHGCGSLTPKSWQIRFYGWLFCSEKCKDGFLKGGE